MNTGTDTEPTSSTLSIPKTIENPPKIVLKFSNQDAKMIGETLLRNLFIEFAKDPKLCGMIGLKLGKFQYPIPEPISETIETNQ
jgi:hypothetical protein